MLLELHANPGDLSPEEFANAVHDSGLDAVVVARTNRADGLKPYLSALETVEVDAFIGVELALEKGMVIFIPRETSDAFASANWTNEGRPWTRDALKARLGDQDGAVIAGHPYYREEHPALGDRVYQLTPLAGVVTRIGRGRQVWDRLAEQAATKRGVSQFGSSGGDAQHLGAAATVFTEDVETQSELVDAIKSGTCLTIEMDDPAAPRDREPPRPASRDGDDRRGGRDGRGRRPRD